MRPLSIFLMIFSSLTGWASIVQVASIDQAIPYFVVADDQTLALFDVDMVLVQPSDPAFQMANMKKYGAICKKIMQTIPEDKQMIFLALMSNQSEAMLIDERTPELLRTLQERTVPTMALTSNLTGALKDCLNMERWRVSSLKRLGIDFSKCAPYAEDAVFTELPSFRNNHSVFTSGILFANGTVCSKGSVLTAFFEKARFLPQKVIFIDDKEDNLKDVETSLFAWDKSIEFIGLHFLGAKDVPAEYISESQFEARWAELANESLKIN